MRKKAQAGLIILLAVLIRLAIFINSRLTLFGLYRHTFRSASSCAVDGELFVLKGMQQCEDIEYVEEVGKVYAACSGNGTARWGWWPPWGNLDRPEDGLYTDGGLWEGESISFCVFVPVERS